MTPEAVLAAVTAVANAIAEGFKFSATDQGQALIKKSLEDRAAFDKNLKEFGEWWVKLFSGKLVIGG